MGRAGAPFAGGEVVLTAALTGPIATKADHPRLPTSPEEIAAAAAAAYDAGAAVAHVHLRDAEGLPTADPEVGRATVAAIQERSPILIQLSTGVGLEVPFEQREQLVELKPAMATLNVASMTFGEGQFLNPPDGVRRLAARMRALGVKPELEIYDFGHLNLVLALLEEDLLEEPLQVSFVMGVTGGMSALPEYLIALVHQLPENASWQVIGVGRANLPMTSVGIALGGNARTGLEDTLRSGPGRVAQSNAELVAQLAAVARAMQREVAGVAAAAAHLGLTTNAAAGKES
jgi:3-keto-5-aminohexanoate cleavage enzyme